mgnify:CR=1 FL=1
MNREDILEVLQSALLWIDKGKSEDYLINPKFAQMGVKLAKYLQKLEI